MADAFSSITTTIRNRLLAIPAKAAILVASEQDPDTIESQLQALLYEALTELGEAEIKVADASV